MKKSNIFYAMGTLVLAVGGFMVTKANKKAQFNAAHARLVSNLTINASAHFTTIKGAGARTAYFATINGATTNLHTLMTVGNSKQVFYK